MGKPSSLDLRQRICAYVSTGTSARSAGRLFGVSAATAVRFAAEYRDHGTAFAKPQGRPAGRFGKRAPHRDFLMEIVQAEPDITLKELAAALADAPEAYGSHKTLYNRWKRRTDKGVFARMMVGLAAEHGEAKIVMIDATYLKVHRTATSMSVKKGGVDV